MRFFGCDGLNLGIAKRQKKKKKSVPAALLLGANEQKQADKTYFPAESQRFGGRSRKTPLLFPPNTKAKTRSFFFFFCGGRTQQAPPPLSLFGLQHSLG